jgi:UDPglucose 6-dehydrogenase
MDISIIGLGRLGSPWAAVLASKGHRVIGVDVNPAAVAAINGGQAPVRETGLEELIAANRARLTASADIALAIRETQITFIVVATPSNAQGAFSLQYVRPAVESIGQALRDKETYHLVVLTSTVMPGDTDRNVRPWLEAQSGKRCGPEGALGLCYNPEFIALGSVIRDMRTPDMVLIGESDVRAGDMLAGLYQSVCENSPHMARMNFINAEITKLAVNTFVTTKISYANMLARLCERLEGANVDAVTTALGADSRIGRKYLMGAVSYGGPCFPRDNLALQTLAAQLGAPAMLAEATHLMNQAQVRLLTDLVMSLKPRQVAILGLAYKTNTDVCEHSFGVALAKSLLSAGAGVAVYDPAAIVNARLELGEQVVYAGSAGECSRSADVVVIATPWDEFLRLEPSDLKSDPPKPVIVDCWRILDARRFESVATVLPGGVGPLAC